MSKWEHLICRACWDKKHPQCEPLFSGDPSIGPRREICCFCGGTFLATGARLLVWENSETVACLGVSGVHAKHENDGHSSVTVE